MNDMRKLMETIEEGMGEDFISGFSKRVMSGQVSNQENIVRNTKQSLRSIITLAETGLDVGSEDMMHEILTDILKQAKKLDQWLRINGSN